MDIYAQLSLPETWQEYYTYKVDKRHLNKNEEADLRNYIENREYLDVIEKLEDGGFFEVPEKKMIRKMHTSKKRVVYIFERKENWLLKLITFLLVRKYDHIFSDSLYSFRINTGVNKTMKKILAQDRLHEKYTYKADISNYFNSIPVDQMLEVLKTVLEDDLRLYEMFERILKDDRCMDEGTIIHESMGVMAGSPFAVFLANVYLKDLDHEMEQKVSCYARYSDDIIIFADSAEEREKGVERILTCLHEKGLLINHEKEMRTEPGETWTFLGMKYTDGVVDISDVSKEKLKNKMRRRARAIKRWQIRKGATNEQAVKAFIRAMNRKFFEASSSHELTWSRWYFPIITTDTSLRELDHYMQQWIRYLYTGKHNNANYSFRYEEMKKLGYVSLVHEWYKE